MFLSVADRGKVKPIPDGEEIYLEHQILEAHETLKNLVEMLDEYLE